VAEKAERAKSKSHPHPRYMRSRAMRGADIAQCSPQTPCRRDFVHQNIARALPKIGAALMRDIHRGIAELLARHGGIDGGERIIAHCASCAARVRPHLQPAGVEAGGACDVDEAGVDVGGLKWRR
jgi:hypothetical protein